MSASVKFYREELDTLNDAVENLDTIINNYTPICIHMQVPQKSVDLKLVQLSLKCMNGKVPSVRKKTSRGQKLPVLSFDAPIKSEDDDATITFHNVLFNPTSHGNDNSNFVFCITYNSEEQWYKQQDLHISATKNCTMKKRKLLRQEQQREAKRRKLDK